MRLGLAIAFIVASGVAGFSPVHHQHRTLRNDVLTVLQSTVEATTVDEAVDAAADADSASSSVAAASFSVSDYQSRLEAQLAKLKEKDSASKALSKEELTIVHEDDHIVVVNKPAGVLTVPGKEGHPSLSQAIFDAVGCESGRADKMVVHRLGMETSGLVVFAKTTEALRNMNTLFRTRKVTRQYEALVCGHIDQDEGMIDLPLMRDYECPPFMRVSTDEHQRALIDLTSDDVDKKLLEQPKASLTKYEVIAREEVDGQPVTRVTLTSISGRTHQLNVHCAAFGHPIVGDTTYGLNGDAAPNGGLSDAELESLAANPNRASAEVQEQIAAATSDKGMCVHAKSISFRHPCIKHENIDLSVDAAF